MQKNRQAEFRRGPGTRVSKYFALGRRRISKAPLFNANCTGICRRGKKNYFVRFIPCRTHPLTPKIHFWRLAKIKPCTAVSPLHPTSFSFFFFFHLSKNFLIFFIYPSKEILRTRFVASFRFVLFCRDNGAVGNLASLFCNLRKQPFAAWVLETFSLRGGERNTVGQRFR